MDLLEKQNSDNYSLAFQKVYLEKTRDNSLFLKIQQYVKNEFIPSKLNSKLDKNETIEFYNLSNKNNTDNILAEIKYDSNEKTYFVYLNFFKNFINDKKKKNPKYLCKNCEIFYDKDEIIYHSIITKHFISKKTIEIKCEIHDKDLIFLNINEKKLYCEDCKINSIFDLISLISKFPSKIIYSNNEIFYGNLINGKKEGIGIYYFNDSTIFIGNFINDFPLLPGLYKDLNGNLKEINEEWGDIQDYKTIQNIFKSQKFNAFFLEIQQIFETIKGRFDVELKLIYSINNELNYTIHFIKNCLFLSKEVEEEIPVYIQFLINNFNCKKPINFKFETYITKGITIYLENYQYFQIERDLNQKPILLDNKKNKIIFYFSSPINIKDIIKLQNNISQLNKSYENDLFKYLIYFIINEKNNSNKKEIASQIINLKKEINVTYAFIECKGFNNLFEFSKYKSKPYFLIVQEGNVILKVGEIYSFKKKFLDLIQNSENKIIKFLQMKNKLFDLLHNFNSKKQLSYNPRFNIEISYKFQKNSNEMILISNPKLIFRGN